MKQFLLLITVCTLLTNIVYAKETSGFEMIESMKEYAASPEDKVLMTSFTDLIKEKYQESKIYPQIVGDGIPASFILFEDGEIVLVLDMANIKMGNNTTDDIDNFLEVLTKSVGKKNMHSYYLNNEDEQNKNNVFVRLRLK